MDVCVVGGGNAAFETALQLSAYCKHVTVLVRSEPRADEITVAAARAKSNVTIMTNTDITAVEGTQFVNSVKIKDAQGTESTLPVAGVFVEIGHIPNTAWLDCAVTLDTFGHITTDPRTQRTSHPRIWAAGDCTDGLFQQNNIAVGDAIKSLENLYLFLHKEQK
jgi:thioredoxin reductase